MPRRTDCLSTSPDHPHPHPTHLPHLPPGEDGSRPRGSDSGLGAFAGHGPAYVEGVTLRPWRDDGSAEFAAMWERVQAAPVREPYQWRPLAAGDERYDRPSPHRPRYRKAKM